MKDLESNLRTLINKHLDQCCPSNLPRLKAFIASDEGREHAEDLLFSMCKKEGIAVQTAMSLLDTEL